MSPLSTDSCLLSVMSSDQDFSLFNLLSDRDLVWLFSLFVVGYPPNSWFGGLFVGVCLAHFGNLGSPRGIFFTWSKDLTGGIINIINKKPCPVWGVYVAENKVVQTRPHPARQKESCFHFTYHLFPTTEHMLFFFFFFTFLWKCDFFYSGCILNVY